MYSNISAIIERVGGWGGRKEAGRRTRINIQTVTGEEDDIQYLLIHPAVKQSSLHSPSSSLGGGIAASHNIIVREDGSVLCHNVKQVDPAHFNRLADVVVGCRREEMKR